MTDFSASAAWFFTTWPIPRGTPGVFGAVGNQQTCSAQAFFAQFSLSTVMYNTSLAIYYVLVIVKGWKDDEVAKIEPFLHVNAIAWGLGTGLASLGLTLFNQVGWDCWISAAPLGCQESWNSPDGTTTCVRGDNGSLYQWAFYYAPLWFCIVLVSGLMYWVYYAVRAQETKMNKYKPTTPGHQSRLHKTNSRQISNHKKVQKQAFYYVGAFFVAWLFPTIFQLIIVTTNTFPFPLLFLTALFVPIQGLLNLIVFLRPVYMRYKRAHPTEFFAYAWFRMLYIELMAENISTGHQNSNFASMASDANSAISGRDRQRKRRAMFCFSYLKKSATQPTPENRKDSNCEIMKEKAEEEEMAADEEIAAKKEDEAFEVDNIQRNWRPSFTLSELKMSASGENHTQPTPEMRRNGNFHAEMEEKVEEKEEMATDEERAAKKEDDAFEDDNIQRN